MPDRVDDKRNRQTTPSVQDRGCLSFQCIQLLYVFCHRRTWLLPPLLAPWFRLLMEETGE